MMGSLVLFFFFFFACSLLFYLCFANAATTVVESLPTLSFEEGYTQLFGDGNLMLLRDGKRVHLSLDERTGPPPSAPPPMSMEMGALLLEGRRDVTSGSTQPKISITTPSFGAKTESCEFCKNKKKLAKHCFCSLLIDPILVLSSTLLSRFYVDDTPIREIVRTEFAGGVFPAKPMSLYATIWDGSNWATSGGRYKVNYKYAPYVAEFSELILHGCAVDPIDHSSPCERPENGRYDTLTMSSDQRARMRSFRRNHMQYLYCYDRDRYPTPPPECSVDDSSKERQWYGLDGVRLGDRRRRHRRNQGDRSRVIEADAFL
ncbi:hypothetical protein GW17_00004549 [Ensete ventricosum]|nr:hypothetical protein GW17_00004549 [Ensete ventricosum]RZS17863.1 hypothetical protein BHM03_00050064 [Ensete ventricosum]